MGVAKGTQASWALRRVRRDTARANGHYGKSIYQHLLNGLHLQPYQEGFFASLMRGEALVPLSDRIHFNSPFPTRRFVHPPAPNLQQVAKGTKSSIKGLRAKFIIEDDIS